MRIFTNENNPAALKLLISASFASKNVLTETVALDDKRFQCPKRLPVLQLDSGCQLFSVNAAARFLMPPSSTDEERVDELLEFEASQLLPTILNGFNLSGKIDNNSKVALIKQLATVDNALSGKQYLCGKSISVADVCIWTSLFPLLSDSSLSKELFADKSKISKWAEHLRYQAQFKDSIAKAIPKGGISCLQNVSVATWIPTLVGGDSTCTEDKETPSLQRDISTDLTPVVKEAPVTEDELQAARNAWQSNTAKQLPKVQPKTILPVKGERNVLITSALPYVNNIPHLGNIIGCVLSADVFARFTRLRNCNTLFICGTDEYGTATETKALEEGLTPQQICDKYFKIHDDIYRWFNISFDHFGRTTTKKQTEICQEMFLDLYNHGFMTTESMEQLLCQKCDRYLADRFVEGTCPKCKYEDARGDQCDGCGNLINATELIDPRCKLCSTAPVIRHSDQFFLELPKVEDKLREWLDTVTHGWSHNARVITRSWLKDGLRPRCITRDLKWGIPVPLPKYADKVFYVWFDAPIGYLSMTACYTDEWRRWWQPEDKSDVTLYQFMAKDNVPFHSVMFPTSLIGSGRGYVCVSHLMATEYLNYEDGKFSKSRGVGVFGTDARDTGIASDVWRFYLLYVRPESQDSSFSWADLVTKNNSELLNNLGNFVNRALMFAEKNFNNTVPRVSLDETATELLALVNRELCAYIAAIEKAKLRDGIRHILSISRLGNQYMQSTQPWVLLKGTDMEKLQAGSVIGLCCNISCVLAALLNPYMPDTSLNMRQQLNAPPSTWLIQSEITLLLPEGHQLGKPAPLFTKIDMLQIAELKKKYAGNQKSRSRTPDDKESSVTQLTEAVAKQADTVRELKSRGAPKTDWQPQVNILLDLKKKLASAEADQGKVVVAQPAGSVAELTKAVADQAELVRKMKTGGTAKTEWQPQVAILLDLKKQLTAAEVGQVKPVQASNVQPEAVKAAENIQVVVKPASNSGLAAELEDKVAKQAEVVRSLKAGGASKGDVAPHVTLLLELKKQLAAEKGDVAPNPSGKSKKKGKP